MSTCVFSYEYIMSTFLQDGDEWNQVFAYKPELPFKINKIPTLY